MKMSATKSVEETKPTCFVLMPIADVHGYENGHFARVYEHVLKPAIINAGYRPVRADDEVKTDYIVVGIIQRLVESEMVLCDFSSKNPNVMYELGIRHAFNKPVVLIKDRKTEKIFDIQGLRYTEYDEALRVDTVHKDVGRISSSLLETSKNSEKNLNSIVQLAGIKTAEIPAGQTISPDTELLLSAIGALENRIKTIETHGPRPGGPPYFFVEQDQACAPTINGDIFNVGDGIYSNGKLVGYVVAMNRHKQSITLKTKTDSLIEVSAFDPSSNGLTTIPF